MRDSSARPAGAGRDVAVVLGSLLVLGVLCGVLWWRVVDPAEFTKTARGAAMGEAELGKRFDADAWFVVIGGCAALAAGLVLTAWRSRNVLLTSGLLVLGSVLAAGAMALVGHLLGPRDPAAALRAARLGTKVPERLALGARPLLPLRPYLAQTASVYLAWPIGALAGALLVLVAGPDPDAKNGRKQRPEGSDPG
jgi:hypothetical protein